MMMREEKRSSDAGKMRSLTFSKLGEGRRYRRKSERDTKGSFSLPSSPIHFCYDKGQ